jgi:hypothetical protein
MGAGQGQGEGQAIGTANIPGSGAGVTRGPGSVPLTWGEETPDLREQMTSEGLPAPDSPESAMQLLGFSQLAPEVNATAEGQQSGGAVGATGEAVWKRRMSPEHRKAVQRFFQRGEGDK